VQTHNLKNSSKLFRNNSHYICDRRRNRGPDFHNTFSYICDFFPLAFQRMHSFLPRLEGTVELDMAHIPVISTRALGNNRLYNNNNNR